MGAKVRVVSCLLLIFGAAGSASRLEAVDVGWMQPGVRLWYLGAVEGAGPISSNAEEAFLIEAIPGTDARVVHHSALDHWQSPKPVETKTYPRQGMGPCWIHPTRLQTVKMGEYWMGQEITLVVRSPYTYASFPYHLLPIKALFDLKPERQIVKLSYMIPNFSVGNAYFDAETGILLYYHTLWGANKMFFILGEVNYDFARHAAFGEDDGPHTGFKSLVSEQSLGYPWGVGGGSVIIQSLVETRYRTVVEARVLTALSASGYKMADENYCFFGDVPIVRRIDATQAPSKPPEQWNPFGDHLWWWLPPAGLAGQAIEVLDVPMARADVPAPVSPTAASTSIAFVATESPQRFHFTTLWFGSDGYVTAFAAKDPTIGLDVKPGDIEFRNPTKVYGLDYYRSTMRWVPTPPRLDEITGALQVGATNTLHGTHFTVGSVIKLYVATASGVAPYGPYKPSAWSATALTWPIPATVLLGNGFGSVQVINTDEGYTVSNVVGALLEGDPTDNVPTILAIDGVPLAPVAPGINVAHVDTVLSKGAAVTIVGTGFNRPRLNLYTATGNLGPLSPLAGGTATTIRVTVPASAPTGPATFQAVNAPYSGNVISNAVSAVVGAAPAITSVSVVGQTITVTGAGFSVLSVINLFNKQGTTVVNLGGFGPGGPAIPLALINDTQFTFARPAGAVAGPAFVEVLNPPYIPFSSSGSDPDGAFAFP